MELRIKEIAKEKGLQLKDVAESIGIARESLTRAINGNPQLDTLDKIASALGVDVVELFPKSGVMGYLEYNGVVTKITTTKELFDFTAEVKAQGKKKV